jgi:DNA repair exonuclease SbcCD ATPase subunit
LLKAQIPSKPDAPEGEQPKHTEEELNEQRDKLRSSIERFRQCEPLVNRIREVLALSKEQKAQAQEFRDLAPKLTAISSELAQVESKLVHQREARSQIKNLKQRVKTLSAQCEDLPILKAFADVYSKTGLRQYMIKRYAALLEEQVNKFRRLFFAEPYTFEFRYNKRLDILVHRKMGLTSDVKRLSGAEKRMFTLLLVIADVVLKPNTKRIDTLILDEPESNLGPAALDAFIKALPVLNKLFPKIVILTPRPDLEVPGARIVTVVKRGGKATLIEGRPK